jgi:hypothetical protein
LPILKNLAFPRRDMLAYEDYADGPTLVHHDIDEPTIVIGSGFL